MSYEHTRVVQHVRKPKDLSHFLASWAASIVVLTGTRKGAQYPLRRERTTLGRGPGVDLAFEDTTMSQQHAALEYASGAFHIRDLESTNGTLVNNDPVSVADLKNGDTFQLGRHVFQFVLEKQEHRPKTHVLPVA